MSRPRFLAFVAALVALILLPATAVQGAVDGSREDHAGRVADAEHDLLTRGFTRQQLASGQFVGIDGLLYESAPFAVPGLDGQLYYGADFDVACGIGARVAASMKKVSKLAKVIERTGRRVIWTAAPSKSIVLSDEIDTATLPHGSCDRFGLVQVQKAIDWVQDPDFLPLRKVLSQDERQVYFKTDPHWTTVGASVFARELARRLNPRLARHQHYVYGTESRVGLLNSERGIDTPETAQTALPADHVTTRTAKDSVEDFAGYPDVVLDHSWVTAPAKKTWPGKTLLLGDSFMLFALASMRPIFRHGRFMWVDHTKEADIIRAIKDSDTVVLEILQTFVPFDSAMVSPTFRHHVAQALK